MTDSESDSASWDLYWAPNKKANLYKKFTLDDFFTPQTQESIHKWQIYFTKKFLHVIRFILAIATISKFGQNKGGVYLEIWGQKLM